MSNAPRPGDRAPNPTLFVDGVPTSVHAFRGDRALLLTFLRHLA